jgi:RimJ/RimL family protein N-acetyltransferase
MAKILETERLVLRELNIKDAPLLFALNEDPEVIKYTGDVQFVSLKETEAFLKNYSDYQRNGFGRWAVVLKSSQEFIGWCGLKRDAQGLVDIGYRFFKNQWGKGYATESAAACLIYGFETLHLPEIIGRAHRENLASIRVFEKLQMKYWKDNTCNGIPDAVYYKITLEDYNGSFSIESLQ